MDKGGVFLGTEAPVISWSHSSEAVSDIVVVDKRELLIVEKTSEANVASELATLVTNEETDDAFRSRAILVPSPGVKILSLSLFVYTLENSRSKWRTS